MIIYFFYKLCLIYVIINLKFIKNLNGLELYKPTVNYIDGIYSWEQCNNYVGRAISGFSGMVISHREYGTTTYNSKRNCILFLLAPLGYKIKLKLLDFDLPTTNGCHNDSLLILDVNTNLNPKDTDNFLNLSSEKKPPIGEILAKFCSRTDNIKKSVHSKFNGLAIWWNTGFNAKRNSKNGFRIQWSAYRIPSTKNPCKKSEEFQCSKSECIPAEMTCNHIAECDDGSDLLRTNQIAMKCENIAADFIGSLSGPEKLLFCLIIVFGGLIACCIIFFIIKWFTNFTHKATSTSNSTDVNIGKKSCIPTESYITPIESSPQYELLQDVTPNNYNSSNNKQNINYSGKQFNYYGPSATISPNDYAYIQNEPSNIII